MSVRKKPYLGEIIEIFAGHEVIKVSEDMVAIEITRFKGIEPAGEGRMDIPIGYLEYHKRLDRFSLKKEHLDWFKAETDKVNH